MVRYRTFNYLVLALLLFATPCFALGERILAFDENGLDILNEELRQLQDRTFQVKSSSSDGTPAYLDNSILNITVIGDVTDGTVAGWEIDATSLKSGTTTTTVGLDSGGVNPAIYCGHATPASAPFRVTNAGAVTATSGSIGGWTLASDRLSYGTDADYIGLLPGTGIQMGDSTFNDAEFSVTNAGVLKATSGTIGGWDITASTLESPSNAIVLNDTDSEITVGAVGSTHLQIDGANVHIRSSDYVSGALGAGWNIDGATAEFNNIRARGKISTAVFEKDAISVVGGSTLVAGGDILSDDMTALDASTLTITGDDSFAVNDILRIKDGVDDEFMTVTNIASAPTYTVTRDGGSAYAANTNPIWKAGTAVVNYGASGEGVIFMTASEANAPYISFVTHAGAPWTTLTTKTRVGNLDGIAGCSGYGIYGGDGYLGALEVIDTIGISSQGAIRSTLTGTYPYLEFSNAGLMLKDSDTGGTYGVAEYGTDKYGYGAQAWILNADLKIPWAELKEPNAGASDVASIRLYNRGNDPGGVAEVGDLAVVNGKLMICNSAGAPGTWVVVGDQTA